MYVVTVNGVSREWNVFSYALKDVLVRGEGEEWTIENRWE